MVAEEEGELGGMIGRLERYLDRKKLVLNVEKTKIMRFAKGGGRRKKLSWSWKGRRIEEVTKFTYLGCEIGRNGGQEGQVAARARKAAVAMRQVWGIGKRKFANDVRRRLSLFDSVVWTVGSHGVEVCGWRERKAMEATQERFIRWVLRMERVTSGYIVRKEVDREKLRIKAGRRAWNFEMRLEEGRGSGLARKCWEEIKKREGNEGRVSAWEEERRGFYKEVGLAIEEVRRLRERRREGYGEIERRCREKDEGKPWERIMESRCNRWYKWTRGEGFPEYLRKGWGESRWRKIAMFRLGSEMREGRYWEGTEKRVCRVCGEEEETWEHV